MKKNIFKEKGLEWFCFPVVVTVVMMLAVHGFVFLNLLYSHDSLRFGMYDRKEALFSLGRWVYYYYTQYVRLSYASPWLIGVLCTVYLAFAVVLVAKILSLSKAEIVAMAAVMTTNITLVALFATYIYDADAYCLAIFLASLAVYAREKFPKGWNWLISGACIMCCLGIYQAYIDWAIGLFILVLIRKIIRNKKENILSCVAYGIGDVAILSGG